MVVLGTQSETSHCSIIPRLRTIKVTDQIGDSELVSFHPELARLLNGGIYDYPAVGHDNSFLLIIRSTKGSGFGFVVSNEEVLECPILFRIGGREIVHIDVEKVNEAFDLLVRLCRCFLLS